jgi:two-component system, cell cycle response regulator
VKILVAEDDSVSRRLLEVFLAKSEYEVLVAANGVEAWKVLSGADAPRLALIDWMMPELDGVDVCRSVRKRVGHPYVYIVLLTGKNQKQDLLEALEAGADDYLTKPFDPPELKARLHTGQRILKLQDELIAACEALRYQATHDTLTGLANRGHILDTLVRELARGIREHRPVGALLADLDSFKHINDSYGHQAGDAVLQEVSRRMVAGVRTYDSIGRYGGEEFLVVLPGSDVENTAKLAERIRQCVEASPIETGTARICVTLSLGVAASDEDNRLAENLLIHAADGALYRAKQLGRNRTEIACASDYGEGISKNSLDTQSNDH